MQCIRYTSCSIEIWQQNLLCLKLTDDKAFPVGIQSEMAKNLDAQNITELECGHLPMISKSKELSEIINKFVSKDN